MAKVPYITPRVDVKPPLAGLDRNWAIQDQPPFSMPDGVNVRCRDVFEQRTRLGCRGGHVKAFAQNIGTNDADAATAFTLEVYPTKDTRIEGNADTDDTNFGNTTVLKVGNDAPSLNPIRMLMHFNLSAIPTGAVITSATLRLFVTDLVTSALCKVYRLKNETSPWNELTCTWKIYDTSLSWTANGGDFDLTTPSPVDWSLLPTGFQNITGLEGMVTDAVANRSKQLHMLFKLATESASLQVNFFRSSEYSDGVSEATSMAWWPKLTVGYETGGLSVLSSDRAIRLMNTCRSLNLDETVSFLEPFDDSPLDPALWTHPTWTLDSVVSSGLPTQSGGNALSATANQLRTARLVSTHTASTAALREVQLDTRALTTDNEFSILMDMDNTTPVPAASIRLRGKVVSATQNNLYLYINEVQVALYADKSASSGDYNGMRLRIDATGTIKGYWRKFNNPSITFTPSGYTAAGGRVGFGLKAGAATAYSSQFEFMYLLAAAGGIPSTAVVASANGILKREDVNGNMIQVNDGASDPTLASDIMLSSVNRLQKLYIADYALKREGTAGVVSSSTTFTDAGVSDWTALTFDSDVIVNGTFAADSDWTKGAGWTIAAGVATATGAISTDLSQTVAPLMLGRTYRVTFTVTRTAGSITPVAGTTNGSAISSSTTSTQDIVCAGSGGFKFSTSGFTGTIDNVSATAILSNVDKDDDRLEIFAGTAAKQGVYAISSVAAASITLASSPGNATGISYRIIRAPKVYDAQLDTLALVPIGTIGATPGQFPHGCRIVNAWLDRLLWSGDPRNPHAVFASKRGDPENYKYANKTAGEAFAYDPAQYAGASQIGDAVTAIIPYSDDYVMFAGKRSISIQRGDPTYGGELDLVTRVAGIIDFAAYCYLPDGRVLGLSTDGLYIFVPGPNMMPERVSRDRLPQELIDINPDLYAVQLQYDIARQGVMIFVTPMTSGLTTHWWFDWTKNAFQPDTLPSDVEPTASCVHSIGGSGTPVILLGGRDGYIRKQVDSQVTDDGTAFTSSATLGPFMLGHAGWIGMLTMVRCFLARQSGSVTVQFLVGDTPEDALESAPVLSWSVAAAQKEPEYPRLSGGACFIRISSTGASQWATETLMLEREIRGMLRT